MLNESLIIYSFTLKYNQQEVFILNITTISLFSKFLHSQYYILIKSLKYIYFLQKDQFNLRL